MIEINLSSLKGFHWQYSENLEHHQVGGYRFFDSYWFYYRYTTHRYHIKE